MPEFRQSTLESALLEHDIDAHNQDHDKAKGKKYPCNDKREGALLIEVLLQFTFFLHAECSRKGRLQN